MKVVTLTWEMEVSDSWSETDEEAKQIALDELRIMKDEEIMDCMEVKHMYTHVGDFTMYDGWLIYEGSDGRWVIDDEVGNVYYASSLEDAVRIIDDELN